MKTILRYLLRLFYGFRAYNTEVLSASGPVLLIPNHVSWLDWLFLGVVLDDDWRFVTSSTTAASHWILRKVMVNRRTFPVDTTSAYAVREMADFLGQGGRLVLFAEGRITVTGVLMKLFDGTGFLIRTTDAAVITCYLRGASRLPFVRHRGWTEWFPRVSAHFSAVQHAPKYGDISYTEARQRLTRWLRDQMIGQQFSVELAEGPQHVLGAIATTAGHRPRMVALEDFSASKLTYRRLMVGVDVLADAWRKRLGGEDGERIGLLLPNVNGMPVTLLSLWAARKVPAILNFSSGVPVMLLCAQLAGLKRVITAKAFIEKAKLNLDPLLQAGIEFIYLDDVRPTISAGVKLSALIRHMISPGKNFRTAPIKPTDTAVVLFTSGSEGVPKGVELTHRNLVANIQQAIATFDLRDDDRFFNALPLFHSFGLTAGTLLPLVRGCYTFLFPSPLMYRVVPALLYDRACTVLFGTNTFLNGYARKAHAYDFSTLRFLVAGAEKVQTATFDTWAKKFGIRILEGYGATECSPVLSVNTPMEPLVGSAGRFLPGIEYRIEKVAGVEEGGRLFVRGPNIMQGYLNPDANQTFRALNGWYDTGDIARVDENGFVHLLGRLKRFAKVSGEMVSLTAVEDALAGAFPQFGLRCQIAIITRPDEEKGEALIAVTNEPKLQLADLRAVLRTKGLNNLSAPRDLKLVKSIPKLGTGKVDHRELTRMIKEEEASNPPSV